VISFAKDALMRPTVKICLCIASIALWSGCHGLQLNRPVVPLATAQATPKELLQFDCDFDLPKNHRLVHELTVERDDVYQTLGLPHSDEPVHVHLYHDEEKYRDFLARHFPSVPQRRAFFVESDTTLDVYAHCSDRVGEDLRHEVAHGYLHSVVPAIPLWLDEGLAEYFEVPRGHGGLNQPHVDLLSDMMEHNGWQPNLPRLETLKSAADMDQADYAESWAWVYFLLHSPPERREVLTTYLAEIHDKGSTGPLSARLAAQNVLPQRTLADYLAAIHQDQVAARTQPATSIH
jgi:Protein of unknown function (DUF1570)